ncbi:hypothetical protein MIND_01237500 [Mycena indigotica]|uniref:NadR/Ttd14 AAA domain-containing protein n=1 Tax=Mycena indigotica TaxID=2126181 RepID=A0A8H6S3N0_9AGAR|nr:uncharacterized protein MIND_01237500 [Mycena indigotica]KAF7292108.1 hypothetical protein MIND_01237500 [Mycena indigotica]
MQSSKRIYIVGPSSTGKSTLCGAIAARWGLTPKQHITEVARTVIKQLGLSRDHISNLEMQKAIMLAHLQKENESDQQKILLCDRSAVDPVVYSVFTSKDKDTANERKRALVTLPEFQTAIEGYRNSLFILLTPVSEWIVDDGFRHVGNEVDVTKIFQETLHELGIHYVEIGEETQKLEDRVNLVQHLAFGN